VSSPLQPSLSSSFAVGSLKKGSKQTLSLPSPGFNTLPHLRTTTSSPRFIQQQQVAAAGPSPSHHKRSPSSDSGHGTMHNNAQQQQTVPSGPGSGSGISNVRSNTPVSYHGSSSGGRIGEGSSGGRSGGSVVREVGKVPHTVYLHGKWKPVPVALAKIIHLWRFCFVPIQGLRCVYTIKPNAQFKRRVYSLSKLVKQNGRYCHFARRELVKYAPSKLVDMSGIQTRRISSSSSYRLTSTPTWDFKR
jgi:hypothetical protein